MSIHDGITANIGMKTFLLITLAALLVFTFGMFATRPSDGSPGKTTLVWVTDQNPLRTEQTTLFARLHPGDEVSIDPGNGDTQKVIVQCQAGVGPDVFDYWGEGNFTAFVKSGIAFDLTDEFAKRGIRPQQEWWPLALPWTVTPDGRVFGVPCNVGVDAIWFRKDLCDAAHVPYPRDSWSQQEFIDTAERLTLKGSNGKVVHYGFLFDFYDGYDEFLPSFGGTLFNKAGTACTLDSPPSIACVNFLKDLIYKYHVSPSPDDEQSMTTGGDWGGLGPIAYFRKSLGAMALGGRWWLAQLRGDIRDRQFRLGSAVPPVIRFPHFSGGGTRAIMVNRQSKHLREAIEFAVYLATKDYSELLNDQGDALAGPSRFAYTDRYLHNPRDPGQDYHEAFRKTLEMATPLHGSPFITMTEVDDSITRQFDLVKLDQKSPEQAMRDAAYEINDALKRHVRRDPNLLKLYLAAGGVL